MKSKFFLKKFRKRVDRLQTICYNDYSKKQEVTTMDTWYTVNLGAMVQEQTFNTYEDAEMFALGLAVTTGELWHVELAVGSAI